MLRRGHPRLRGAVHVEGCHRHERLQRPRRERAGRPPPRGGCWTSGGGLRPHPLGAATTRLAQDMTTRAGPYPLGGRPGIWPASWPPTPTTSACPRQPPRPTAGWRGSWPSPASPSTKARPEVTVEPGSDRFVVRAAVSGWCSTARGRRCGERPAPGRLPGGSGPALHPERPGRPPVGRGHRHRRGGLRRRDLRGPHRGDLRRPLPVPGPDRGGRRPAGRARRPGPALELGIGTRRLAIPLSARGVTVHGVDASDAMVAKSCGTSQAVRTSTSSSATSPPNPRGYAVPARVRGLQHLLRPPQPRGTSSGASGRWPHWSPARRFLLR